MAKDKAKKPDDEAAPGVSVGGSVSGSNITIGNNNTTNIIQPPPAPEIHSALGAIPPARADAYVRRGNIEEDLRAALRKGGASAIVGLHAPGGTGKTELAYRIANEAREGKLGFENALWLNVNDRSAREVAREALRICGIQLAPEATQSDELAELRHYFLQHKLLVVFDDVRSNALGELHSILPPAPCAALITSRVQQMAGVKSFALDRMEPDQARELFVNSLGEQAVGAEEEAVAKLAERCKYNPLALEIASRRILQDRGMTSPVAAYLKKAEARFEALKMHGDERWNMTAVFDISYNDLAESDRKYFRALAVFAPDGFSPRAAAHLWELDEGGADDILNRFRNLSLILSLGGRFERYRLHDLLDEYAALKLSAEEEEENASRLTGWLVALFKKHYTDDAGNAPEAALEFANLAKMAGWAERAGKGEALALLATQPRNWLYNYFRNLKEWLHWLSAALALGIADAGLKANVLQAIGDVQQFRDERDAALVSYNEALKLFR
ncbi:MAG: hypothetical protein DYG85_17060, partial [Chloroflexi bacterium CFX1]|nr:hypothetical protein [Chloroflexi bacterium CFX1]MDL1920899.1 hypothetical protein [Chloroflexi bacterium CFX5]